MILTGKPSSEDAENNQDKNNSTLWVYIIGGMIGVLVVRGFFLDTFEEIGWRLFWEELTTKNRMDLKSVLNSSTFIKSLTGFIIGGFVATFIWPKLRRADTENNN